MEHNIFRSPQAIAAALPGIFGFRPEKSIVVVVVTHNRLGVSIRLDLDDIAGDAVGQIAELVVGQSADCALLFVIDDTGDDHRLLVSAIEVALANRGIPVRAAIAMGAITAGARWRCLKSKAEGVLEDPASSPAALAAVLSGRPIFRHRAELGALIAHDTSRAAALEPLLADNTAELDAPDGLRRAAQALLSAVHDQESEGAVDDARLAELAAPLTDLRLRDMMFATALCAAAQRFETLWEAMARALPVPYRVEALLLLGVSAYVRGDGTMCGIALEAVLQHNPEHRLARLLDKALQSGAPPSLVEEVAELGYQLAEDAGVDLPGRRVQTT